MKSITQENYGKFLNMIYKTLDRTEVTDVEARNNYKEILLDYCEFLYRLSPLPLTPEFTSQQKFLQKLEKLLLEYINKGDDFIEDRNVETFLINLQNNMRDYLTHNLEIKLYSVEKGFYSNLAWDANNYTHISRNTHEFQNEQQNAIEKLIAKGPNFLNKPKTNYGY